MNYSLQNFVEYFKKRSYPISFILFALWMCIGIFPLVCYETDSQEVILGCDILYYNGWKFPPTYCYEYRMQPLTVITVATLRHILSFLTCEQIYCLLTAISSFIFLIGNIEFAQHITRYSRTKILIAAILLPEMYAITMYPNSAIPAAACFIWAFINIIKKRHWAAILLMCIAPLFRVDVVIVYPTILPLLIFAGKTWKKSICISSIYCVIIISIGLLLFHFCRADVLSTFEGYEKWNEEIGIETVMIAIFGFYSITYFILLPIGIIRIGKQKLWKELFLVLQPIILLHLIYSSMGCAAKHYLYIAPFVIIIGTRACSWLYYMAQKKMWIKYFILLYIALVLIVSVRINSPNSPWRNKDIAYTGTLVTTLASANISSYNLSIGIGAGQLIPTMDEKMLASGQLFYSWHIHYYKKELNVSRKKLKKSIDSLTTSDIVTTDWGERAPILSKYLREHNHVKYNPDNKDFRISNANRSLTIRFATIKYDNEDNYEKEIKKYSKNLNKENLYVIAGSPRRQSYLDSMSKRTNVIKVAEMVYKINNM